MNVLGTTQKGTALPPTGPQGVPRPGEMSTHSSPALPESRGDGPQRARGCLPPKPSQRPAHGPPSDQLLKHQQAKPGFLWEHKLVRHREPRQQNQETISVDAEA